MATNANECFKSTTETSLGIAKGLVKALICIRSHFIAEEGYSILTETSTQSFLVSDNKKIFISH